MTSAQAVDLINSLLMLGQCLAVFMGFSSGLILAKLLDQ